MKWLLRLAQYSFGLLIASLGFSLLFAAVLDLPSLVGDLVTIALSIGCGIGLFVGMFVVRERERNRGRTIGERLKAVSRTD